MYPSGNLLKTCKKEIPLTTVVVTFLFGDTRRGSNHTLPITPPRCKAMEITALVGVSTW
jgi:hypothetical protein